MNRHRAAGIHLAISTCVVVSVLTIMLLRWYPDIWFAAMGGRNLLFILAAVDIVIGPLLTWIVFKPGKKTLKFDLAVIATLQLAAMFYGLQVLYEARPAYVVFVQDQFRTVSAAEVDPKLLELTSYPEFRIVPTDGPRIVGSEMPDNPGDRQTLAYAHLMGIDLHLLPQFWLPYDGQRALRAAGSLDKLRGIAPDNASDIERFLKKSGKTAERLRYLPLRSRHKEMAVLLDTDTGDVAGIVDARPWN